LSSALNTNWWHLGMAGRLPEFLCPRECVGQQDFIGFDYYWGISSLQPWKVVRLVDSLTQGRFDLAPVAPAGLYSFLKFYARLLPGKEIVLVENGCVDAASGIDRVAYLQRHLHEVQKAVDRGIPISNFIVWSITSNFEWGFTPAPSCDFGLYHIDLVNDSQLQRHETPAAVFYREVIKTRSSKPNVGEAVASAARGTVGP